MKSILLLLIGLCSVAACKKAAQIENSTIVGKWELSEYLADPGDGSGTWLKADPLHPNYIEFKKDGSLSISPYDAYSADHYQVTSDSTLIFFRNSENFPARYHYSPTLLTLHPACIEACGERFTPVP